ncbi:helix-turn-helix domain-containing protein [Marinitenerispora sediminis]|uniref:Transcriptional regulator n=1 Tax=Marinitenerispora sediminis TaxID=1931232 RepID=A0A368T4Z2_9ACTN|nr:helix-turn-helix transcriptional regulator [Marinitenerispora sediminis]RCV48769.1 transcriptional regulator [Marinitenerispora sediminis]RCV50897.1 transcriptional regulator [Marinitenerispora sediminis]RCV58675.1 transcriptional regulator [Marinitenerispora sediminis]
MSERQTVARWELAKRLRALRADRGFNAVAKAARVAPSSLARWESTGENSSVPGVVALERLLQHYGVDDETFSRLIALRKQAKQSNWWQGYELKEYYGTFISLEEAANSIGTYECQLIPGLLQTEEYARAITKAIRLGDPEDVIEAHVKVRRERQEKWWNSTCSMWAIIGESAITQRVGGVDVMKDQIRYLTEVSSHPRMTLQVLPFSAGAHAALEIASFVILRLDNDDLSAVYLEGSSVNIFLDKRADLERYETVFNRLRAAALDTEPTRELLQRQLTDLGG